MVAISFIYRFAMLGLDALRSGLAPIVAQLSRLVVAFQNRQAVKSLAELDERALHDIGLVRSDVLGALETPYHRDPSSVLVRSVARGEPARRVPHVTAHAQTPVHAVPRIVACPN